MVRSTCCLFYLQNLFWNSKDFVVKDAESNLIPLLIKIVSAIVHVNLLTAKFYDLPLLNEILVFLVYQLLPTHSVLN